MSPRRGWAIRDGAQLEPRRARWTGAFQRAAGQIAVVQPRLILWRHVAQFGARDVDQTSRTATPASFTPPLVIGAGTPR